MCIIHIVYVIYEIYKYNIYACMCVFKNVNTYLHCKPSQLKKKKKQSK